MPRIGGGRGHHLVDRADPERSEAVLAALLDGGRRLLLRAGEAVVPPLSVAGLALGFGEEAAAAEERYGFGAQLGERGRHRLLTAEERAIERARLVAVLERQRILAPVDAALVDAQLHVVGGEVAQRVRVGVVAGLGDRLVVGVEQRRQLAAVGPQRRLALGVLLLAALVDGLRIRREARAAALAGRRETFRRRGIGGASDAGNEQRENNGGAGAFHRTVLPGPKPFP